MKSHAPNTNFQRTLFTWFKKNRRDLPWRHTTDPYLIAVSEVMLQQTQVERMIPKYLAWRRAWPRTSSLADASLHDILKLWSGLGYNSRAVRLRQATRLVMEKYHGRWPRTVEELESLPGVGPYTAKAIASFSYNDNVATIDTNIRRVVTRMFYGVRKISPKTLEHKTTELLPNGQSAEWHAALMDFGSAVCTSRQPKCEICPLQTICRAYPKVLTTTAVKKKISPMKFQHTDRYWRGAIIRQFLDQPSMSLRSLVAMLKTAGEVDENRITRLVNDLNLEGIIYRHAQGLRLSE